MVWESHIVLHCLNPQFLAAPLNKAVECNMLWSRFAIDWRKCLWPAEGKAGECFLSLYTLCVALKFCSQCVYYLLKNKNYDKAMNASYI